MYLNVELVKIFRKKCFDENLPANRVIEELLREFLSESKSKK